MLDLRKRRECVWDLAMRPVGEGDHSKEPFAPWWARWGGLLAHLHPRIAAQWVFCLWCHSYMAFLELASITWRLESWPGDQILSEIHLEFGGPMLADHDYETFNRGGGFGPIATARAMITGTWYVPLVALATPNGIRSGGG